MFETFRNAWKVPDLRKKLLYTLLIVLIFRVGAAIPVPYLDASVMNSLMTQSGSLLGYVDMMTGGAFSKATLFALSVTPYITATIVMQLLTIAIGPLERLSKEGEEGRKKIAKITRWVTIALALVQAIAYYFMFKNYGAVKYTSGFSSIFAAIVIVLAFTAGAGLVVWIGEQINEKGIGNGVSILLFAGIISRFPITIGKLWALLQLASQGETKYFFFVPLIVVLFIALIAFIVVMTNAERRIPVQYAKRVVGRKMYGGQNSHIPVKVNMSGVMPIIFASSLLAIPSTVVGFVDPDKSSWLGKFFGAFNYNTVWYALIYFVLIIGFNYFYVAIQYNPLEIANNLRKNSGTIPGIRPGKPTAEFIGKIISKVTLVGALFLAVVAILPIAMGGITGVDIALGGTSIIIVVGVALDTARQLETQMMSRHYKGFLE